jgi:ParB family chromosome partitioning protein
MARQSGLGRGLASLIPQKKKSKIVNDLKGINYFGGDDLEAKNLLNNNNKKKTDKPGPVTEKEPFETGDISLHSILDIPVDEIKPNPYQPRTYFNEEKLAELADSIKKHGVLQPLIVSYRKEGGYELIAGERRLEAGKIAGLEKIPVIVKKSTQQQKLELALIENVQRHNLNVIEEARAYKKLQDEFGLTQEEIAERAGKNRSTVANIMRLLSLPVEIQRAVIGGKISEGHARMLLSIANPEKQRALFNMILKDNMTVRQLEDKVKEVNVSSYRREIRMVDQETKKKEEDLASFLGTKVRIKKGKKGGQIQIDFYSEEELIGIWDKIIK